MPWDLGCRRTENINIMSPGPYNLKYNELQTIFKLLGLLQRGGRNSTKGEEAWVLPPARNSETVIIFYTYMCRCIAFNIALNMLLLGGGSTQKETLDWLEQDGSEKSLGWVIPPYSNCYHNGL